MTTFENILLVMLIAVQAGNLALSIYCARTSRD